MSYFEINNPPAGTVRLHSWEEIKINDVFWMGDKTSGVGIREIEFDGPFVVLSEPLMISYDPEDVLTTFRFKVLQKDGSVLVCKYYEKEANYGWVLR